MPSRPAPCTASAAATLAKAWRTCASMPPSTTLPASSNPPCPAVNTRSPAATDWEYCTLSAHANGGRPVTISMAAIVEADARLGRDGLPGELEHAAAAGARLHAPDRDPARRARARRRLR